MSQELRCPNKKHAALISPGTSGVVEVKCDSRFCGAQRGVVVLHRFSTETGQLLETVKFKSPEKKGTK